MAVQASRILFDCRRNLAKLFGVGNPNDIAFASSTTMALNQAIFGLLRSGDHVVCTSIEHNSVRRPLEYMKKTFGVELTYVPSDSEGNIDLNALEASLRTNTRLIACSHSSNLLGTIMPVEAIGSLARQKGIKLLVDAAQTAGVLPIDVERMGIHMLAFPGHKGLLGPQGTGGLYIHPELDLVPLMHGGTGSQSESHEQPSVRPDRYEAGTPNTPGIAGLNEGVKFVLKETVEAIRTKEEKLTGQMMAGLLNIPGVRVLGPGLGKERAGIVSFLMDEADSSEIAFILDQQYDIAVRSGYHCSPLAHGTAGTLQTGAVRASVGYFTTEEEVEALIQAVRNIAQHYS